MFPCSVGDRSGWPRNAGLATERAVLGADAVAPRNAATQSDETSMTCFCRASDYRGSARFDVA
jgi:hypothetical protein